MKKRRGLADRGYSRRNHHRAIPALEQVEARLLMAVFTVSNTLDSVNATADDGSFRGEILASNGTNTANSINFSLPAGLQTISLVAPLPAISTSVLIDGTTATGFNTNAPVPLVRIDGGNAAAAGPGLVVNASGTEIRDLIITDFTGDGIQLNGGTDTVDGCYIGVDPSGNAVAKNGGVGILVASPNNTIGATTTNANVISGNSTGIQINGSIASKNLIVYSRIGTNAAGTAKLGNLAYGIEVDTPNNTIGGVSLTGPLDLGNLISGNGATGLLISAIGANGNLIQGNYIGTSLNGLAPIKNGAEGINLNGVKNTLVGGPTPGAGNVIGGNSTSGILIRGLFATNNLVQGNLIGIGPDRLTSVGNGGYGVFINGGTNDIIGGSTLAGNATQFANVIAFNGQTFGGGVEVTGGTMDGILTNSIYSNNGPGIQLNGANAGVKPPVLGTVQSGAAQTRITGTLAGLPSTNYRIQFFSSLTPNVTGIGDGQNFLGDYDIITDSIGNATFTTTLATGVPVGYSVSATATQNVLVVNNTSSFATDVQATQASVTDLAVSTVTGGSPLLNQPYTYTVTVTNRGPNDSTGVILSDTIPTNSTFVSSNAGTYNSATGVLTDPIGNLAANQSVVVTITVKPTATGTLTNTAIVTGDELDTDLTNNKAVTTDTVSANADLAVLLTASSRVAPVGSPISYTLSVGNNGPSTATGTVVTVRFPGDFTGIVVQLDQGTYQINPDNSVTITLGTLPASSASTIVLTANPSAIGDAVVTATVTSMLADPNPANNSSSATVMVANAADLGVTISGAPNPVLLELGQELLYTVTVTNNGPSVASSPVVLDPLPAGLTYDPTKSTAGAYGTVFLANPTISAPNGTVVANLHPLASGASATITIAVFASASGQVVNTVTVGDPDEVAPAEIDTDLSNNTATSVIQVSPADVSIVVNNPQDPLFLGSNAVYQLEVANNGPATATNVTVLDSLGLGGMIVQASAGTITNGILTANLGSLAPGQMVTIYVVVAPTASGTLVNSASITSDNIDPNPNNNSSSSSNLVSPVDLMVGVTGSPSSILLGQPAVFIVTVTNNGPAPATNVRFTDALPSNAIFAGVATTQGSVAPSALNTLSGNLGTLAPGATVTITILLAPEGISVLTDVAAASSDNFDTNANNNLAAASVSVINLPGTIQFNSLGTAVAENAGYVLLTVARIVGTQGTVSATYTTQDDTAIAGVNYTASTGLVTFLDGQTTATIAIAVLDDFKVNGNNTFFVVLSGATGGASIGGQAVTSVVVLNTDRDLIPPAVSSLVAIPNGTSLGGFLLAFDKPLDPGRASLVANYHIFLTNATNNVQREIPLRAVIYNPSNNTVTLVPTTPLPANRFYEVVANGSTGLPITDLSGNVLYGSTGPGTNYVAFYGQTSGKGGSLVYDDSQGNVVTISLSGGGTLAIFRGSNGDATEVDLLGIVPHRSKLTGSVKKLNKHASGNTHIGSINGFGQFGFVKSSLTTPPFYVRSAPVTAASVRAASFAPASNSTKVAVESIAFPTTITKKATPRGPHRSQR